MTPPGRRYTAGPAPAALGADAVPAVLDDTLESFHDYIGEKLARGRDLSPELALALWRARLREVAAIREGLDDVNRGETVAAADFLKELDAEFGFTAAELAGEE